LDVGPTCARTGEAHDDECNESSVWEQGKEGMQRERGKRGRSPLRAKAGGGSQREGRAAVWTWARRAPIAVPNGEVAAECKDGRGSRRRVQRVLCMGTGKRRNAKRERGPYPLPLPPCVQKQVAGHSGRAGPRFGRGPDVLRSRCSRRRVQRVLCMGTGKRRNAKREREKRERRESYGPFPPACKSRWRVTAGGQGRGLDVGPTCSDRGSELHRPRSRRADRQQFYRSRERVLQARF
jgi:hypothetical protein